MAGGCGEAGRAERTESLVYLVTNQTSRPLHFLDFALKLRPEPPKLDSHFRFPFSALTGKLYYLRKGWQWPRDPRSNADSEGAFTTSENRTSIIGFLWDGI